MSRAKEILEKVIEEDRKIVLEPEAYSILEEYDVPVAKWEMCENRGAAVAAAGRMGYPVVMKVVSPQIVHKTEYEAVEVGISNPEEVQSTFDRLMGKALSHEGVEVKGILITKMLDGLEMIVGATRDSQFGPLLMFGLGGIFVEVFKDVSYRIAPLDEIDVEEMLSEIKGRGLIEGFRGREGVDIESLTHVLMSISRLLADMDLISEMDLNPMFGDSSGVKVADARILLG
jgi:succinyl-CoA synthetase beta subunit